MPRIWPALTSAALLGISGCADMNISQTADKSAAQTASAAGVTLDSEAQAALSAAQADVEAAKARNALWTTAADALKNAEAASTKGDSAMVLKQARLASEQARKGMAQLDYPMLKIGD